MISEAFQWGNIKQKNTSQTQRDLKNFKRNLFRKKALVIFWDASIIIKYTKFN